MRTPRHPSVTALTRPLSKYFVHSDSTKEGLRVRAEEGLRGIMWILRDVSEGWDRGERHFSE